MKDLFKNKLHIIKIFSIITLFVIIGVVLIGILQPETFNKFGHYRWNAIAEIQSQEVIHQDINTCKSCHKDIYKLHQKDAHNNVNCVVCHGPGNLHVSYYKGVKSSNKISKAESVMEMEYTFEGCLYCHRKLKARPSDFPQIDKDEHYKYLNIVKSQTKCVECHSPHEPIFLLSEVKESRLHPIVFKCTDCHDKQPEKSFRSVKEHPTIFECKDCHAEIEKDFKQRQHHKNIECRTCHLFHKENETTGRIFKIGNAKFCLLCHEKKPFKDKNYPPQIEWPAHIGKLEFVARDNEKICLNCHSRQIHKMGLNVSANPHPKNWAFGHKIFANESQSACKGCHSTNQCSSCHSKTLPKSHMNNWLDMHPLAAKKNKASCQTCHDEEFCSQCH